MKNKLKTSLKGKKVLNVSETYFIEISSPLTARSEPPCNDYLHQMVTGTIRICVLSHQSNSKSYKISMLLINDAIILFEALSVIYYLLMLTVACHLRKFVDIEVKSKDFTACEYYKSISGTSE